MVSSLRQKNTNAQKEDTHIDQKKNHITDRMVSGEVVPGALVCPGIWRLRTRQGGALGDITEGPALARTPLAIVMTSGQRTRRLAGVNWEWGLKGSGEISSGQSKKRWGVMECHLLASVFFLNLVLYWEGGSIFYF